MKYGGGGTSDFFLYDLPRGTEEEKTDMLCTTVGSVGVRPGVPYPQNKNAHPEVFRPIREGRVLPEFQLVYVTGGEGLFSLGADVHRVRPGSVMLVLPGLRHAYHPLPESGWHEYWVGFRGGYFSGLLSGGVLSPERVFFEPGVSDDMLSVFAHIFDDAQNRPPFYQMKACSRILYLISEILGAQKTDLPENHYESIVRKAKRLMEDNVCGSMDLSDVYSQIGISSSSLNEIFKARTSVTPYQYYIDIKIRRAKMLLECDGLSVKEVAYRTGFADQYYFSRLFKNKTGFSPTKWAAGTAEARN